jgi:excisionase family DNA binding protein
MNVEEAAEHFGVGKTTIREAVATNQLPHTNIGTRLIILVDAVKEQALKSVK